MDLHALRVASCSRAAGRLHVGERASQMIRSRYGDDVPGPVPPPRDHNLASPASLASPMPRAGAHRIGQVVNGKARVLVVDDEPGIAMVLTELLMGEGYEVRHTGNGYDALRVIAEWLPDLVILDLTLPGIEGVEVARRVRDLSDERAAEVPVVVITGAHDGLKAAAEVGARAAIQKPFSLELVVDAVDNAVRRRTSD